MSVETTMHMIILTDKETAALSGALTSEGIEGIAGISRLARELQNEPPVISKESGLVNPLKRLVAKALTEEAGFVASLLDAGRVTEAALRLTEHTGIALLGGIVEKISMSGIEASNDVLFPPLPDRAFEYEQ